MDYTDQNDFRDLRVLLVDDDEGCRDFLVAGLQMEGVIVTPVGSAEEAIEALEGNFFDCITTDMNLPGADGLSLLKHIRENSGDIPVLLITGYGDVGSAVDALKLGAQDYIAKPIESIDILLGAIWKAVEHYRVTVQNKALQERLQRAEKMETLANLAGGVAHDLNNILSPMVSLPDLINEEIGDFEKEAGIDAAELKEDISLMKASGLRAAAVVRDLMTSSRRANYQKRALDINKLLSTCLKSQEVQEMRSVNPSVTIDLKTASEEFIIEASEPHVSRAIANLLRNSVEAMDESITGVEVSSPVVKVTTERVQHDQPFMGYDVIEEGDYARLRVEDCGVGISEKIADRVFEPFFTTKKQSKRSGSGLGLAVVHGIMKDHGGFIDVKNAENGGAVIDLYFPLSFSEIEESDSHMAIHYGDERVLVVDDEPAQRHTASRMLGKLGYTVSAVSSGSEALALFDGTSEKSNGGYDIIVLDMIMEEGFDGLHTLRKIREHVPDQRAIIASGFAPTGRVQNAIEMGAGWIAKPYSLAKLSHAVRDKLDS